MGIGDWFRKKKYEIDQNNADNNQKSGENLLEQATTIANIKEMETENDKPRDNVDVSIEAEGEEIEEEDFQEPAGDGIALENLEDLREKAKTKAEKILEEEEKAEYFTVVRKHLEVLDQALKDAAPLTLSVKGIDFEIREIANHMVENMMCERMESVKACLEALEDGIMYCRTAIPKYDMKNKRAILKKRITILREHVKFIQLCEDIDNLTSELRKAELEFSERDDKYWEAKAQLDEYKHGDVQRVEDALGAGMDFIGKDKEENKRLNEIKNLIDERNNALAARQVAEKDVKDFDDDLKQREAAKILPKNIIARLHLNLNINLSDRLQNTLNMWEDIGEKSEKERKKWNDLLEKILAVIYGNKKSRGDATIYNMNRDFIQQKRKEQIAQEKRMERLEDLKKNTMPEPNYIQNQVQEPNYRQAQTNC